MYLSTAKPHGAHVERPVPPGLRAAPRMHGLCGEGASKGP